MQLIKFGGVKLPRVDEQVAFPNTMQSGLVSLPNGSFDEHGQPSILQSFRITREFKVACNENDTDLAGYIDDLMRVFASGRKVLECLWRDGSKRQTFAKVMNSVRPRLSDDRNYQQFTVEFEVNYPFWLDSEQEPLYLDHGWYLDTGLYIDGNYTTLTIDSLQEAFTITNNGLVPNRRGTIVVRPQVGGSVTNLVITNQTNWYILRFLDTLSYPESLVIDLLSRSVKVDVLNAYSSIQLPVRQMEWMRLEIGDNDIVIDCDSRSGNVTFEWHWSDPYL